jgi:hypothetical protein
MGPETKNDCAGKDQQQITAVLWSRQSVMGQETAVAVDG